MPKIGLDIGEHHIHERRLNKQRELLKNQLYAGYVKARRADVVNLVAEMERQAAETGLSTELRARIYLLAANAFFPNRIDGDAGRSRDYLDKAAALPLGSEWLNCKLAEGSLLF